MIVRIYSRRNQLISTCSSSLKQAHHSVPWILAHEQEDVGRKGNTGCWPLAIHQVQFQGQKLPRRSDHSLTNKAALLPPTPLGHQHLCCVRGNWSKGNASGRGNRACSKEESFLADQWPESNHLVVKKYQIWHKRGAENHEQKARKLPPWWHLAKHKIKQKNKEKAVLIHSNGSLNFTKEITEFSSCGPVRKMKFLEFASRLSE